MERWSLLQGKNYGNSSRASHDETPSLSPHAPDVAFEPDSEPDPEPESKSKPKSTSKPEPASGTTGVT